MKFYTGIKETSQIHNNLFLLETLLPWQPYDAFSWTPQNRNLETGVNIPTVLSFATEW